MSVYLRLGLRTRLALALAGVAVASVALATLLSNAGLHSRLDQFARDRLQAAAVHSAQLGATLYRKERRWTPASAKQLGHLAEMNGYRLVLRDASGRRLKGRIAPAATQADARVVVATKPVGLVTVAPLRGQLPSGEDRSLSQRLNHLHLLAGGLAIVLGVLAAVLLAPPLARPLRRLTSVARRMERGDLTARVKPGGAPEIEAIGEALNRLAETLQREEEIRRAAAADIAHELRSPLAGILSRIEAAQDDVMEDARRNLEAMHTEAMRLTRLVEDLGKLAEAEQPGLTVEKRPVDLGKVVAERAEVHREHFNAKGIALQQRTEPASVYGDRRRLTQIVDNLLSNALRYTDPGGRVTIAVEQHGGEVAIEVADTGAGIGAEDLPHIFERFWRGEQSRARKTGGAGIGLAIVRELVRAHDGRIDVESTPGEGSRFRVALPVAHLSPRTRSEAKPTS